MNSIAFFSQCMHTEHNYVLICTGRCRCGSTLQCKIDNFHATKHAIFTCAVKKGDAKCGKRYFRQPMREEVAKLLCKKPAEIYRIEQAGEKMLPGRPEPPNLPGLNVLKTAKHQFKRSQYLHEDPRRALELMKHTNLANVIHTIGLSPFMVHFWTNTQIHIYFEYAKREPAEIFIDATGGIIKKIIISDEIKTKVIFIYFIVINTESGQICVAHMITESHNTISLLFFLLEWVRLGAPHPKVVTSDGSVALLTAIVRAFTGKFIIDEYVDSYERELPSCYVRMDGAHFMNLYVKFLKNTAKTKKIRAFYKGAVGQLMVSCNEKDAMRILKAILTVAHSETDGNIQGLDDKTDCEKENIFSLLKPDEMREYEDEVVQEPVFPKVEAENLFDWDPEKDAEDSCLSGQKDKKSNKWLKLFDEINNSVLKITESEHGEHDSAYCLPILAKKLRKDMTWFPLWSCIYRDRFGYGKIPASSAAVECEFKNLKDKFLNNEDLPMRADEFVQLFIQKYIRGRENLYIAKDIKILENKNSEDNIEDNNSSITSEINENENMEISSENGK